MFYYDYIRVPSHDSQGMHSFASSLPQASGWQKANELLGRVELCQDSHVRLDMHRVHV